VECENTHSQFALVFHAGGALLLWCLKIDADGTISMLVAELCVLAGSFRNVSALKVQC